MSRAPVEAITRETRVRLRREGAGLEEIQSRAIMMLQVSRRQIVGGRAEGIWYV